MQFIRESYWSQMMKNCSEFSLNTPHWERNMSRTFDVESVSIIWLVWHLFFCPCWCVILWNKLCSELKVRRLFSISEHMQVPKWHRTRSAEENNSCWHAEPVANVLWKPNWNWRKLCNKVQFCYKVTSKTPFKCADLPMVCILYIYAKSTPWVFLGMWTQWHIRKS